MLACYSDNTGCHALDCVEQIAYILEATIVQAIAHYGACIVVQYLVRETPWY